MQMQTMCTRHAHARAMHMHMHMHMHMPYARTHLRAVAVECPLQRTQRGPLLREGGGQCERETPA